MKRANQAKLAIYKQHFDGLPILKIKNDRFILHQL